MPVTVTMPDAEIAELAHELAVRKGVSEIEAVRFALRLAIHEDDAEAVTIRWIEGDDVDAPPKPPRHVVDPGPSEVADASGGVHEDAVMERIRAIVARAAATRRQDNRSEDDILGYPEMFPELYGRK
jgi:hypothetical protein